MLTKNDSIPTNKLLILNKLKKKKQLKTLVSESNIIRKKFLMLIRLFFKMGQFNEYINTHKHIYPKKPRYII